jgi:hypothetical protein
VSPNSHRPFDLDGPSGFLASSARLRGHPLTGPDAPRDVIRGIKQASSVLTTASDVAPELRDAAGRLEREAIALDELAARYDARSARAQEVREAQRARRDEPA